ncbi:hypothetical protein ACFWQC_10870 [Nocardioides sp. NPDC058538]|uniref:hypothetical protein n=1 Tax=Nocardioides sp. NPDC058538 TaxID=3346542 RepID=UPI0036545B60
MGAAVISGLFAVALACLAWIFKNGSRRARLLSRIERYIQLLKDLPEGHPARVHLDAALAADTEQLLALTERKATAAAQRLQEPWLRPASRPALTTGATDPGGAPDGDERDDIDWMGDEQERRISPPDSLVQAPRHTLLSGHGSTVLWVLAALAAVVAVGLAVNDLLF